MIVRILEDGQYELGDDDAKQLSGIDARLAAALDGDNDEAFDKTLAELIEAVHRLGKPLEQDELRPSDLAVPAAGSSREEVKALLSSESATKD